MAGTASSDRLTAFRLRRLQSSVPEVPLDAQTVASTSRNLQQQFNIPQLRISVDESWKVVDSDNTAIPVKSVIQSIDDLRCLSPKHAALLLSVHPAKRSVISFEAPTGRRQSMQWRDDGAKILPSKSDVYEVCRAAAKTISVDASSFTEKVTFTHTETQTTQSISTLPLAHLAVAEATSASSILSAQFTTSMNVMREQIATLTKENLILRQTISLLQASKALPAADAAAAPSLVHVGVQTLPASKKQIAKVFDSSKLTEFLEPSTLAGNFPQAFCDVQVQTTPSSTFRDVATGADLEQAPRDEWKDLSHWQPIKLPRIPSRSPQETRSQRLAQMLRFSGPATPTSLVEPFARVLSHAELCELWRLVYLGSSAQFWTRFGRESSSHAFDLHVSRGRDVPGTDQRAAREALARWVAAGCCTC